MVNIDVLKPYLTEVTENTRRFYVKEVDKFGLEGLIEYFKKVLNCNRISDGLRMMQTISYLYRSGISEYVFIINTFVDTEEEKDKLLNDLLILHQANIEFEKVNPPIPYKIKNKTVKQAKEKKVKEPKEKGPSALERKIAAKALKLSNLSFKIS